MRPFADPLASSFGIPSAGQVAVPGQSIGGVRLGDRLTDRAHVIGTGTETFRFKEPAPAAEAAKQAAQIKTSWAVPPGLDTCVVGDEPYPQAATARRARMLLRTSWRPCRLSRRPSP